ncbi:cytochrome oxidase c subunit VIb-domain-containing protein, partial [Coniella lustricola]
SEEAQRAEQVRAGARAPDRTERKRCWEARDQYFACLDRNNILDALKDEKATAKVCGAESVVFERDCAREWVSYFKKWRVADHNKKQRLRQLEAQGAQSVEI